MVSGSHPNNISKKEDLSSLRSRRTKALGKETGPGTTIRKPRSRFTISPVAINSSTYSGGKTMAIRSLTRSSKLVNNAKSFPAKLVAICHSKSHKCRKTGTSLELSQIRVSSG